MAKAKAEAWLTTTFAEGATELACIARPRAAPAYRGALGRCWLAQHDRHRRKCSGRLERIHLLRRQTVEDAVWRHFWGSLDEDAQLIDPNVPMLLAAWDPRNAEVGCEGHHRRFDHHIGPALYVPLDAIPGRLRAFADDYALDHLLDDRFPTEVP